MLPKFPPFVKLENTVISIYFNSSLCDGFRVPGYGLWFRVDGLEIHYAHLLTTPYQAVMIQKPFGGKWGQTMIEINHDIKSPRAGENEKQQILSSRPQRGIRHGIE